MFRFILRKMLNKKWLFIALLIGNILLTGIACSNPLFADAVMQRMLMDDFETYLTEKNAYPGAVTVTFSGFFTRNSLLPELETVSRGMPEKFGVRPAMEVTHYYTSLAVNTAEIEREDASATSVMVGALDNLEDHVVITAGRMYSRERREDGTFEVIVSQRGLMDMNMLMGERRTFPKITDRDGNPITVEVVGVFDLADSGDLFWVRTPSTFRTECLMSFELFSEQFVYDESPVSLNAAWYELLDVDAVRARNAQSMQNAVEEYQALAKENNYLNITFNFASILSDHLNTARKVRVTLWVLQTPIYILLAAFIFMVSRQILETEESEISVLKSRGVRKGQIIGIYLGQSVVIALIAVAAGIPLGSFLTQVLGSANAFLEFVSRSSLPVEIRLSAFLYAGAAALLSVCAMVLPVRRYSGVSIVVQKQKKHRRVRPLWQKAFLDFIALGVSLYGLYTFNQQKELLAQRILSGEVPDPVLFLCSSLFIIGAGLVAIRFIPLFVSLVFHLFKKLWSPALYASFLKVLRQRANQDFIMIFLVMTIALGVFNAQTASTINENAESNTRYVTGADVVLSEVWDDNSSLVEVNPALDFIYYEPDFNKYTEMEGVEAAAKVYRSGSVSVSFTGGTLKKVSLMAIDTDDFGKTAWFDSSLLPSHWYHYLNAMAQNARAVLLSSNFKDDYHLQVGDVIYYTCASGASTRGIIYGFVDYWPGYSPYVYTRGTDGVYRESANHLIVANLSQVQDAVGLEPYDVWIKTKNGSDFLYDYAEETGTLYSSFKDAEALIVEQKNDPMLKSLNGVLTVGFIVVLALCFIGFLMYWILSIRQRELQFGIYRAMGMSMREIFVMLLNEQFCISLLSIAVGAVVGQLASRLYMPLIQIAYSSADNALPLRASVNAENTVQLVLVVGAMLLVCMTVLATIIRRMKIAQALKLGED